IRAVARVPMRPRAPDTFSRVARCAGARVRQVPMQYDSGLFRAAHRALRKRTATSRPFAAPSAKETEPEDVAQRGDPVPPCDLLAFLVGSSVVANWDLVDSAAEFRDLHRDFGLEAEPVGLEREPAQHLVPEDLVADLHVRDVQSR